MYYQRRNLGKRNFRSAEKMHKFDMKVDIIATTSSNKEKKEYPTPQFSDNKKIWKKKLPKPKSK